MAGSGPAPKPSDQRRRRNKVAEVELPASGNTEPYPPLPGWREWSPDTVEWYDQWCKSPMATEWADVHFTRLQQVALVYDDWVRSGNLELVKELRLQLAGFGGTPIDLRKLGRKIGRRTPGEVVPIAKKSRRLRAVDTAG